MKNYLTYLISDIRQAAKNLPEKPYYEIPPEAEGIEYVIEWENAEPKPMQEWFGIDKKSFPPVEQLSKDELELLVAEIVKLWEAYNFEAELPENIPTKIAYRVLVDYFDKPVEWISEGTIHIEFCDYDPENCPFPKEFCTCNDSDGKTEIENPVNGIYTENGEEIAILDKEIEEIENKNEDEFLPIENMIQYVDQLVDDMIIAAKGGK